MGYPRENLVLFLWVHHKFPALFMLDCKFVELKRLLTIFFILKYGVPRNKPIEFSTLTIHEWRM